MKPLVCHPMLGVHVLPQVLEALMLVSFGLSWPINAYKNYMAGTAAGTSWQFIGLITLGYFAGIAAKFASSQVNWVLIVYFINLGCLAINWAVYFRNVKLDHARVDREEHATTSPAPSLQHVIIASDGSQNSLKAASFAAQILDLKHAGTVEVLAVAGDGSQTAHHRADVAVSDTSKVLEQDGIECSVSIREGVPAAEIVDEAVKTAASVVVMGSRGLSGLKELVLGSVSREVTDNIACPALIIK